MTILRISQHKPMTLIWWWKNRHQIDFSPPYQRRGRLWSDRDKAYLVDSIINGFDVPKLYLADFQFGASMLNTKRLPYAVIDGKQRLDAIFDFFENKLVLNADFKYRKNSALKLGGLSLRDLRSNYSSVADDFDNASLDIMSVFSDDEEDVNEIFVRLNRSKPLTGAEIRNAVSGPVPEIIRKLATHVVFTENIRFGIQRAGDLNAVAKVLLFEYEGKPTGTKKIDLDKFADDRSIDDSKLELSSRRVIDIFDSMVDIFIPKDLLLSSAGLFPVYYWFIGGVTPVGHALVREFLHWFEVKRSKNRTLQKNVSGELELDRQLARFDTLNRSTNDQQSHSGRVTILREFFAVWAKGRDLNREDLFVTPNEDHVEQTDL